MDETAVSTIREQHEKECAFCHYAIGEFCEVDALLAEVERLQVENQRLYRQREEAILRRIEAENPGIDIERVARERRQRRTV